MVFHSLFMIDIFACAQMCIFRDVQIYGGMDVSLLLCDDVEISVVKRWLLQSVGGSSCSQEMRCTKRVSCCASSASEQFCRLRQKEYL